MVALSSWLALTALGSALGHDPCECKFQGAFIPEDIYTKYPSDDPGKYAGAAAVKIYGTSCAAWDQVPDTPWASYCPLSTKDWSNADYNWCQQPWCYVDEECPSAVKSSVFDGSDVAYYSYMSCGHTADCYTNIAWNATYQWPEGCPYDPYGTQSYKVHKAGDCACSFQGQALDEKYYKDYPDSEPGKYENMSAIAYYGTTCAAWDQVPGTPWSSYCPADSDWCHTDYNWCQQPWCYVAEACSTGVSSSVFAGSDAAFYSYDTCLNTPDCYTGVAWKGTAEAPAACPFDSTDNMWHTAAMCPSGWTDPPTCGEARAAYKASNCCGNPSATFDMEATSKRRLGQSTESALLEQVRRALEGPDAAKLAAKVRAVLREHSK